MARHEGDEEMDMTASGKTDELPPVSEHGQREHGRGLAAPVQTFDLYSELHQLHEKSNYGGGGPVGRTLVKEPDLRIVLLALPTGGRIEKHHASGPISIHVLEGRLRLRLPEASVELTSGQLLAIEPDIPHDVEATEESAFLLTLGRTTYHTPPLDHHETHV